MTMTDERRQNLRRQKLRRRRARQRMIKRICFTLLILLLIGGCIGFFKFRREHFRKGTVISGVDCSGLTVEKAEQKLNMELENNFVTFKFSEEEQISHFSEEFDLKLANAKEDLKALLQKQNKGDKTREYYLEDYSFDSNKLREILQKIPNLQKKIMKEAQNAYLSLSDDNLFIIIPEVKGTEIDFEEAYSLASHNLKKGELTIDFSEIITLPEIISTNPELISQANKLNKILSAVINFSLPNGSTLTLDKNVITNWIVKKNDNYEIDIDSNLPNFISNLATKVSEATSSVDFKTTDSGVVTVPVKSAYRAIVDQEKELEQIKSELVSGKTVLRSPIYTSNKSCLDNVKSYIELDISNQRVLMYIDGKCVVDTPCVTGNVSAGNSTPAGLFYLTYKETDTYLRGYNNDGTRYNSHVDYWMPFNGGIGFHDASWRSKFGGSIYVYNGSHGCVNLPLKSAKTIYEHIDTNMPIIVYESETK